MPVGFELFLALFGWALLLSIFLIDYITVHPDRIPFYRRIKYGKSKTEIPGGNQILGD